MNQLMHAATLNKNNDKNINNWKHLECFEYFFTIMAFLWGFRNQMKLPLLNSTPFSTEEGDSLENT